MNRSLLTSAINNSGLSVESNDELDFLFSKLEFLKKTNRYEKLLSNLINTNDKSNFLSGIFEVTFAYHFEINGLELTYEVQQLKENNTSVDFLRETAAGKSIFFEARLIQEQESVIKSVETQLANSVFYEIGMFVQQQKDAIVRLQNIIISKVQNKQGTPIKFLKVSDEIINIVVVDVTNNFQGHIDIRDCLLVAHGDPAIEKMWQVGIFGLFQNNHSSYPDNIQEIYHSLDHFRKTVSGILFMFKTDNSTPLNYVLKPLLLCNPKLVSAKLDQEISNEIYLAFPR